MNTQTTLTEAQSGQAKSGKDLVKNMLEANKQFIAQVLPRHLSPERLMNVALTAYSQNPGLRECTTPSVIGGIVECSTLGLEPNTRLGQAYLIPFNNRHTGKKEAQLIIGYKGLIDLFRRSGYFLSIHADVVRENDLFEYEYGTDQKLRHKPADGDRGGVLGYYAYVHTKDGGFQMAYMTLDEVHKVRDNTPGKGKSGPWKDHPDPMGIKTAIRKLSKLLPLSPEMNRAIEVDDMAHMGISQSFDSIMPNGSEILDGEVEGDAPDEEKLIEEVANKEPHPYSFEEWQDQLSKAKSPDDLDVCESLIGDLSKAVQPLAKSELAKARK